MSTNNGLVQQLHDYLHSSLSGTNLSITTTDLTSYALDTLLTPFPSQQLSLSNVQISSVANNADNNLAFTVTGAVGDWTATALQLNIPTFSSQNITLTFIETATTIVVCDYQITSQITVAGSTIDVVATLQMPDSICFQFAQSGNGTLSLSELIAFVIGSDTYHLLPNVLSSLGSVTLKNLSLQLNCSASASTSLVNSLTGELSDWPLIPDILTLQSVNLTLTQTQHLVSPGDLQSQYSGCVNAVFSIPDLHKSFTVITHFTGSDLLEIEVLNSATGDLPSIEDMACLIGGTTLQNTIKAALSDIGFTSLTITEVKFIFRHAQSGLQLQSITINAALVLFGADFTLSLQPPLSTSAGWIFNCSLQPGSSIAIGTFINHVTQDLVDFTLPPVLDGLEVTTLGISINSQTQDYSFALGLDFPLTETTSLPLLFNIDIVKQQGVYNTTFAGQLNFSGSQFDVTFGTDKILNASWNFSGIDYLQFQTIADVFDFTLPNIPSSLDLSLKSIALCCDLNQKTVTLAASSANYGNAVFTSLLVSQVRQHVFLLGIDNPFSLSNLPLVGHELASIDNIEIGSFCVAISSISPMTSTIASQINALIQPLGTQYPQIPTQGFNGKLLLSAKLNLGNKTFPLQVSLDNSSGQQATEQTASTSAATTTPAHNTDIVATTAASPASAAAPQTLPDGTTWFTIQKSFGPLSIQKIGVRFSSKQQMLWFEIDASVMMGPTQLSLQGLGIGSPLSSFSPQFQLQGLGVGYDKPPLNIAGSFVNLNPPGAGQFEFDGGVTIGAETFELQAFGFYGNQTGVPSMFIFGDVAKAFGGPPAFFVTGIALGFGYNSQLTLPSVDQVANFPFIQTLPDSNPPNSGALPTKTPQAVLNTLLDSNPAWVTQHAGDLWFAAGITFTSFEMVNSQALIIVEPGDDLTIALLGTSQAQFPQNATAGQTRYAYIELELDAEFKPEAGAFTLEAVLSKSSFLLDPACVLTGGFAFYVWFGDNPHAGDFVLTLGGYNPYFTPPSYYPTVPELGFHWSLDSSISISGNAYLAFTPSVMMVGGALNAVYHSGNLKAWFDAEADIIVQWKPFWFDAHIGINIGASYRMDLLFTSVTVSIELGCDLSLWGPPSGGNVHVDWFVISFTVPFGTPKNSSSTTLGWSDVQTMLPNTGTAAAYNVLGLTPVAGTSPLASCPDNGPTTAKWHARSGQFAFAATTSIPVSTATFGSAQATSEDHSMLTADSNSFTGSSFNIAPLQYSEVKSTLDITVKTKAGVDLSGSFVAKPLTKSLPASLWGSPPKHTAPNSSEQLVASQLVGVSLEVLPPQVGASAGAVNIQQNLTADPLQLAGATLPVSASAQPAGQTPSYSATNIASITNSQTGIAATATQHTRTQLLGALQTLGYLPHNANNTMTGFSQNIANTFTADPLMIA